MTVWDQAVGLQASASDNSLLHFPLHVEARQGNTLLLLELEDLLGLIQEGSRHGQC